MVKKTFKTSIMQISFNDMLSSSAYEQQKAIINREAQEPRFVPVDKSIFSKTDKEKEILFKLKAQLPKTRNHKFVTFSKFTT
jgi:hypothetical protein